MAVNFTGTAGVWRASAIERAGGWRAASLVEDCELSFRALFCGYTTRYASVDVPAELPDSVTSYKAQQKRWTLGWAQLIRLHLGTLLWRHECSLPTRVHLLYHMLLSTQWPLWLAWQLLTPWIVALGQLLAEQPPRDAAATPSLFPAPTPTPMPAATPTTASSPSGAHAYASDEALPTLPALSPTDGIYGWPLAALMLLASLIAAVERSASDGGGGGKEESGGKEGGGGFCEALREGARRLVLTCALLFRVVPSAALAAGMLPHQACAWFEGIPSTIARAHALAQAHVHA